MLITLIQKSNVRFFDIRMVYAFFKMQQIEKKKAFFSYF